MTRRKETEGRKTYDYVPSLPGFDEVRNGIPSKWTVGGSCPNCEASERSSGTLMLVDRDDTVNRFLLACTNHLQENGSCGFRYGIDSTFSATVPDDYQPPSSF